MLARHLKRAFSSITINLPEHTVHRLDASLLPKTATATKEELVKYLTDMLNIRRVEIAADEAYKKKQIRGFCHLCDGQEAVYVGMEAGLTIQDPVITAYRDHGNAYVRGESPRAIFAEMFGKITGTSKGKGGSMHYYNKETNFYGGNGIVGAQIPVGTGLAFALKYKGAKNVAVAMYGDGAANQGQFFEAINMAYLWKLPCLYVCENNLYGMGTSTSRAASNTNFHQRGDVVPGIRTDAMNVLNVREIFKFAKNWSIENGPLVLELMTYRYHGHSMSDPGTAYRVRDEVAKVRNERDPILILSRLLIENSIMSQDDIDALEADIKNKVKEDMVKAAADPYPDLKELFTDIYDPSVKYFYRNVEYPESIFT